jgi:hypothetical protein
VGGGAQAGQGSEVGAHEHETGLDAMEVADEVKKRRFLWGVLLVWTPWIPILIGLGNALIGISRQKATGIGAVAGGLTELFVVWGIGSILIGQMAAIVLLIRAFSPGHWMRSLFSILTLCISGLMLLLVGLFLWLSWFQKHHTF